MLENTSASVHSICTSSALPSDLLTRSSAVVIEQAQYKKVSRPRRAMVFTMQLYIICSFPRQAVSTHRTMLGAWSCCPCSRHVVLRLQCGGTTTYMECNRAAVNHIRLHYHRDLPWSGAVCRRPHYESPRMPHISNTVAYRSYKASQCDLVIMVIFYGQSAFSMHVLLTFLSTAQMRLCQEKSLSIIPICL